MKISLNWLRDYINLDSLSTDQISELLTDIGLEVEGVEQFESIPGGMQGLVVGEVVTCKKHENADRLKVCTVDIGDNENLNIVCGAPNVAAGQKVVVATVGTTIYPTDGEPFSIKKAKIRGVESRGMICAEDEIGLGNSHDGIMVLDDSLQPGQLVSQLYEVYTDIVFEIGLTPNRSDAQSHIGVARDLSAAINTQLNETSTVKWPSTTPFAEDEETTPIKVTIEDTDACPRYAGIVISNIEVKDSPKWLQNRLKAIGVKSINNIVDVTNYINHEYGQPLHAFDYDKILGQEIIVKHVDSGTKFTTLDDVERVLSDQDLMICNSREPMCMAGVYGGIGTGVTTNTKSIFLESAYFDPSTIRRTELRHNLKTDAASKFEKGIDPTKQVEILRRSALLIQELAGGKFSSKLIDSYPNPIERKIVKLSFQRLNQLTGIDFEPSSAVSILNLLDFEVMQKSDLFVQLAVPQYRNDVTREADVIEEVLRIYGFNNVPLHNNVSFELNYKSDSEDELRNKLSNLLAGQGFNEIVTNSITQRSYYPNLNEEESVLPLNSINSKLDLLRPDMLMTGLEVLAYNMNRSLPNARCFDFGKVYSKSNNNYTEQSQLAMYFTGLKRQRNWIQQQVTVQFFDAKKAVEDVLKLSGVAKYKNNDSSNQQLQYGLDYLVGKQKIATVGAVNQSILDKFEINQEVFYACIDFDYLLKHQLKKLNYQSISKFPSVQRELALVLDDEVSYKQVSELTMKKGGTDLKEMDLINIFKDESKLGANKKSYAIGLVFQKENDTLTSEEVDKRMNELITSYEKELKATIRR